MVGDLCTRRPGELPRSKETYCSDCFTSWPCPYFKTPQIRFNVVGLLEIRQKGQPTVAAAVDGVAGLGTSLGRLRHHRPSKDITWLVSGQACEWLGLNTVLWEIWGSLWAIFETSSILPLCEE